MYYYKECEQGMSNIVVIFNKECEQGEDHESVESSLSELDFLLINILDSR